MKAINKSIYQPIMNENNMENEKTPLYVAFSTQKGGVGKTTFTVLAASYLYYLKGYDVAVVDCDYPQHSIAGMRKRDAEQVGADEDYKRMAYEQFTRLGKKAYPVLCSSPEKAIATADEYIAAGHVPDIVFFDLPGTVNSEGVINSLVGMGCPPFLQKKLFFRSRNLWNNLYYKPFVILFNLHISIYPIKATACNNKLCIIVAKI